MLPWVGSGTSPLERFAPLVVARNRAGHADTERQHAGGIEPRRCAGQVSQVIDEHRTHREQCKRQRDFRNDEYLWWQVAEYGFDSFQIRSRSRG